MKLKFTPVELNIRWPPKIDGNGRRLMFLPNTTFVGLRMLVLLDGEQNGLLPPTKHFKGMCETKIHTKTI